MKRTLSWISAVILLLAPAALTLHAQERDITGIWQGTLQAGQGLRTQLRITKDDGKLKAVMYSIDQSPQPIPVSSIALQGTTFTFEIKQLDVTYTGTLNSDGTSITGNATQGGQTHALNFDHVNAETAWALPAPPKVMDPNVVPKFDVVTIKPSDPNRPGKGFGFQGRHAMTINTTMNDLVTFAYGLHPKQIINAPDWFATEKFDLDGVPDQDGRPSPKQLRQLVQFALADRFKLTFHRDQKELAVYAITVAKGGSKLTESIRKPNDPSGFTYRKLGQLTVTNDSIKDFCDGMQGSALDKPVVDHTGLTARYDFTLDWTPDESQFIQMGGYHPPATEDPNAPPALNDAMQQQLGLKIEPTRALADVIVIDHVDKPSAN
jgi:uncharacterized protein (TIGR03435 family)